MILDVLCGVSQCFYCKNGRCSKQVIKINQNGTCAQILDENGQMKPFAFSVEITEQEKENNNINEVECEEELKND